MMDIDASPVFPREGAGISGFFGFPNAILYSGR
jgi:hypothetical protein